MSLLDNVKTDQTINGEKDSVGGYQPKESGLYTCTVSMAYLEVSQGGAGALNLTLKPDDGSSDIRQKLWIMSGNAKGNKNYYEKNGEKFYLPGFNLANSLAFITVGKELSEVDTEEKIVNVYSYESKAEVPTKVEVLMELLDKEVVVGLHKQIVDRKTRQDDGSYQPNGETREENEIDKFFSPDNYMTMTEIQAQATEPGFYNTWNQRWTGVTRDRSTGVNANSGQSGAPAAPSKPSGNANNNDNNSPKSGQSLFAGKQ